MIPVPVRWIRFALTLAALWALSIGAGAAALADAPTPLWWGVRIAGVVTALSGAVTIAFRGRFAGEVGPEGSTAASGSARDSGRSTGSRTGPRPAGWHLLTGTARVLFGVALVVSTLF